MTTGADASAFSRPVLWTLVLFTACVLALFGTLIHIYPFDTTSYYGLLGDAFFSGQTSLRVQPSAALLALHDPYNPPMRHADFLWDASLYHKHYYLYFGPAPALIWAAVKGLTGFSLSDPALLLGFVCAGTASLLWLLAAIARREQMADSAGLLFAMVALGLATWLPMLLRRPSFYEVAIGGGFCFTSLGLLLFWQALQNTRRSNLLFLLCGVSFAAAAASRLTFAVCLPLLGLICYRMRCKDSQRLPVSAVAGLLAPLLFCLMLLAYYNYVRFGSVFETGVHYQLTVFDVQSPDYHAWRLNKIIPNLFFYLLRPLIPTGHLTPLFDLTYYRQFALPFGITAETYEPVFGLLANCPFCLFLLGGFYLRRSAPLTTEAKAVADLSISIGGTLFALLLLFFFTSARYAVDFSPWLMFYAGIQYLRLLKNVPGARLRLRLIGGVFALWGAAAGIGSAWCWSAACWAN